MSRQLRGFWLPTLVLVLVVGAALYGNGLMRSNLGESGQPPVVFNGIDSSSCIACHTNEGIISLSTVGKDKAPAANTGG